MKITWASNAPWAGTGYGTQTNQLVRRLISDGHEVVVAANHGLTARPLGDPDTGVMVFPSGVDAYGNDVLPGIHRLHTGGDGWIITLYDVWVYKNPELDNEHIASWVPIDHSPVPPQVLDWCRKHPAITMSKFGQQQLADAGIVAPYAPHALDLDVWKPTELLPNGQTARQAWGIPDDAFLVMVNAANKGNVPPRKSWGEMLRALAEFMTARPDTYLYLHTEMRGIFGGVDLIYLAAHLGMPAERIRVPDQFANLTGLIPQQTLAAYYTAADVLLATSMGEGFGIPVIEAQACGTPVIVTDFSAQPELVGAGWKVPYQPWWDFTQGADLALPSIPHIVVALDDAYQAKGDATLRAQALAKAQEYEADAVFDTYWRPILADLADQLKPKATRQQRRAKRRKAA